MRRFMHHIYREPRDDEDWEEIARRFIKITTADPEIDGLIFCRLGPLFAVPNPKTYGQYARQTNNR